MAIKACARCGEEKRGDEFHDDKRASDGKRSYCASCELTYRREWNARLRADVRGAYGNVCACCGEDEPKFLSVDHIDGTSAARRRSGIDSGFHFHLWLRREGFPPGFQILCHNCNQAKGSHGHCPHKDK